MIIYFNIENVVVDKESAIKGVVLGDNFVLTFTESQHNLFDTF